LAIALLLFLEIGFFISEEPTMKVKHEHVLSIISISKNKIGFFSGCYYILVLGGIFTIIRLIVWLAKKIVSSYQSHSEQKLTTTQKNEEENRNKKIFSIDKK
jgi:hypothetical protein